MRVVGWRMLAAAVAMSGLVAVQPGVAMAKSVTYRIVTNEIKGKQADGSQVEVYRFDPAVYVATEGDDVTLQFYGVKGHDHPIVLEGYNVKGTIHKNEETTLKFHASKPGFYRVICTAHEDLKHNGPMEAYVVVVPGQAAKAAAARATAMQTRAETSGSAGTVPTGGDGNAQGPMAVTAAPKAPWR